MLTLIWLKNISYSSKANNTNNVQLQLLNDFLLKQNNNKMYTLCISEVSSIFFYKINIKK